MSGVLRSEAEVKESEREVGEANLGITVPDTS